MILGTITKWRGHMGWIRPDGGSDPEVFVTDRDLPDAVRRTKTREGLRVCFEIIDSDKGPNASNVKRIS
jgi:cold shock CspA family protein